MYQMLLVESTIYSIHQDNFFVLPAIYHSMEIPKTYLQTFMDFINYLDDFRPGIVSIAHF